VTGKPPSDHWKLTAERTSDVNRTFSIRDENGEWVGLMSFRSICALAAVEAGPARAVRRRRSWYGMYDEWLEPHTDLFGVGSLTLQNLQSDKLVARCVEADAALTLTEKGREVLAAIRAAGVETLLTEAIAA
jgi:hypothetical protein